MFAKVFQCPKELSSDASPEFVSNVTAEFFRTWNVKHRISSAYHPRSNGRAEVAVKSAKRLLRSIRQRQASGSYVTAAEYARPRLKVIAS